MEENEILNRIYSYVFYTLGVLCVVLAAFFSNLYLIAVTSILLLLSAIYLNSGHIVNNILIKRSNIVEIYNHYKLSSELDSAVKKIGNGHHALSIAFFRIEKPNNASNDAIKALLETLHESFEFGILVKEADKEKMIETLDTKRRMKEITLSRIDSKHQDKINALKREIDILAAEIQNIRKSGKALEVLAKIISFGNSENEAEAAREASKNIKRIADSFSAALGVDYKIIKGEELLNVLEAYS